MFYHMYLCACSDYFYHFAFEFLKQKFKVDLLAIDHYYLRLVVMKTQDVLNLIGHRANQGYMHQTLITII
jgi:hypothetical protein